MRLLYLKTRHRSGVERAYCSKMGIEQQPGILGLISEKEVGEGHGFHRPLKKMRVTDLIVKDGLFRAA